jgi:hypothetical protein
MGSHLYDRAGDRVRIKSGQYQGQRGQIDDLTTGGDVIVVVEGTRLVVSRNSITNFSLAARRAWATRPKRAGRPTLPTPRKKMISLRIDIETLNALSVLAEHGLIANRERAVNEWLRVQTRELLSLLSSTDRASGAAE